MELSSVRLMMADEGNRAEGVRKENRERNLLCSVDAEDCVAAYCLGCELMREKKVKTRVKVAPATSMKTRRGGAILWGVKGHPLKAK